MAERWPRGMTVQTVAEYVGLSVTAVRALQDFPAAVQLTPGRRVYLREDVDAWLARRAGRVPETDGAAAWMTA